MLPPLKVNDEGEWNTLPPVPADAVKNVNCHKFVLYAIKEISWDEMVSDPQPQKEAGKDFTFGERLRVLSEIPWTTIPDLDSLKYLVGMCGSGEWYMGEVFDTEEKEMAHSFIIQRTLEGNTCFDKPGFKYPFAVSDLETIFNFVNKDGIAAYQNQEWRFVPMSVV